jgi:hypothetical protein
VVYLTSSSACVHPHTLSLSPSLSDNLSLCYTHSHSLPLSPFRRVLEKEKGEANVVAFQWQNEAKLIETELQSSQEECEEVKRKAEEAELLVSSKDEKISSLVLMLQEALERENEEKEKADLLKSTVESSRDGEKGREKETPPKSRTDDLTTPPQGTSRPPLEESEELSFWGKEKEQDGRTPGPVSVSESASLAKRVLITWDRTPASSRSRALRADVDKGSRTVSYSAFLMTVRTCCPTARV